MPRNQNRGNHAPKRRGLRFHQSIQRRVPEEGNGFLDQIVVRVSAGIEAGKVEAALGQELCGGEVVGSSFRAYGAQLAVPRFGDRLKNHCRSQALPAVFKVHPQINHPKRFEDRFLLRDQQGDVDAIVLGQQRQPFLDAGCHLLEQKLGLIGRLVAVHALLAERALLDFPGAAQSFAGIVDVQVLARLNGAVDIDQTVDIGGTNRADFHATENTTTRLMPNDESAPARLLIDRWAFRIQSGIAMTTDFFDFRRKLTGSRPAARPRAVAADGALTVTELTGKITQLLHTGLPASVLVRGEVSNFARNRSSGHLYFTLKDAGACLDCVMFRGEAARMKFEPTDGMELLADGRIGVYGPRGRYQLYVTALRPLGRGALELAFQQLRAKLEAEGLFAAQRRKPIPRYPLRIVLITSPEAAAFADMLKVLRRFQWLRLMLYPVAVQGEGAAATIAAAIGHVNASIAGIGGADVILLARGGGSLEDLWSFNEEIVARAIAQSRIAIVTGIGHEVDVCIADLVADYHAHTPTEAAQVVTAQWRGAKDQLDGSAMRLGRSLQMRVWEAQQRLRGIERHEAFRRPMDRVDLLWQLIDERQRAMVIGQQELLRADRDRIQDAAHRIGRFLPVVLLRSREALSGIGRRLDYAIPVRLRAGIERLNRAAVLLREGHPRNRVKLEAQRLGSLQVRITRAFANQLVWKAQALGAMARQLEAVSPEAVLRRGYTITSRKRDGAPVRSSTQLREGDRIVTRFADGKVESTVNDARQLSLFE